MAAIIGEEEPIGMMNNSNLLFVNLQRIKFPNFAAISFALVSVIFKLKFDAKTRNWKEIQRFLFNVPKESNPHIVPCKDWSYFHDSSHSSTNSCVSDAINLTRSSFGSEL
jgi:hypothetical protein